MNQLFILIISGLAIIFCGCKEEEEQPQPTDTQEVEEVPQDDNSSQTYKLVWSDEFDTDTIDTTQWSFMIGDGSAYGLDRWGNNELQYYTKRDTNAFIEDGKLVIQALKENFEGEKYTSTRMRTKGKGDWKFGKIEVRARLPKGQGIWPAIWMLPTEEIYGTWPKSGEIDIMELVGHEPHIVHGTIHYGPDWPNNQYTGKTYELADGDFSSDFHIFMIEWEFNAIRFYVDENEFFTVTPAITLPHNYPFNERFHLLLNVAVGGNWPGNPDGTTEFPQRMEIDYVRVYQK